MKTLLEISKIVTKKRVKKLEIFDEHYLKNKNSKFNEFYEALLSGRFKNDRDAARFLYGCSPTDDKYRQLKSRFKKRLLNNLFFLDINKPATSTYERAYFTCNKDWTLIRILLSNQATNTANSMARHTLTTALKFNFTDVILDCSRLLRSHAAIQHNEKDFQRYDNILTKHESIFRAELEAERILQKIIIMFTGNLPFDSETIDGIGALCNEALNLSEENDSPIIYYKTHLTWVYRYLIDRNFEAIIQISDRVQEYVKDNAFYERKDMMKEFYKKKILAYIHLKDFKNGKKTAEDFLAVTDDGEQDWFNMMELYFLLSTHTKNYASAIAIFNEVFNHKLFSSLPTIRKEKWKLFESYIAILITYNEENLPFLSSLIAKPFKERRFLEEPHVYPKDQKVLQIHSSVAQILIAMKRGQLTLAKDIIDKLRPVVQRKMKSPELFRLAQFIKILHTLKRSDFQPGIIKNNKYEVALRNQSFYYREILNELEIVPLEDLWELISKEI